MTKDELIERDELFLTLLFELGSVTAAAKQMELTLTTAKKIAERNRDRIIENTLTELSLSAPKAVSTIRDAMDQDGNIATTKLKAAESVLDRVGASARLKEDKVIEATPVILMPVKAEQLTPIEIKQQEE